MYCYSYWLRHYCLLATIVLERNSAPAHVVQGIFHQPSMLLYVARLSIASFHEKEFGSCACCSGDSSPPCCSTSLVWPPADSTEKEFGSSACCSGNIPSALNVALRHLSGHCQFPLKRNSAPAHVVQGIFDQPSMLSTSRVCPPTVNRRLRFPSAMAATSFAPRTHCRPCQPTLSPFIFSLNKLTCLLTFFCASPCCLC
jgi:hypothetical protein